mgnify:CR=1 FL=1
MKDIEIQHFGRGGKFILVCLISVIIASIIVAAIYELNEANTSAQKSCIFSVEGAMTLALRSQNYRDKIPSTDTWRTLNDNERALLVNAIETSKNLDCNSGSPILSGKTPDGEVLEIEVRRDGNFIQARLKKYSDFPLDLK